MITDKQVRDALTAFNKAVNEPVMLKCERCEGRGYHHGFGEDGHDPDWCEVCGGGQYIVAPGEEGRAMRLALEAAALSTVPSAGALASEKTVWTSLAAVLYAVKEFAHWHHLNETTIKAGKTPSDSEIDFEVTAWNRINRALTHPPASEAQVRRTVKLLEWKQGDEDEAYHFAQSSIENYIITEFADDGLRFRLLGTSQYGVWFYNLGDAKAAAQADYERRVLSALTPEQGETEAVGRRVASEDEVRKAAFSHGYVLACCNLVNLHDRPEIAFDILRELGVSKADIEAMDLCDYDLGALKEIEQARGNSELYCSEATPPSPSPSAPSPRKGT